MRLLEPIVQYWLIIMMAYTKPTSGQCHKDDTGLLFYGPRQDSANGMCTDLASRAII